MSVSAAVYKRRSAFGRMHHITPHQTTRHRTTPLAHHTNWSGQAPDTHTRTSSTVIASSVFCRYGAKCSFVCSAMLRAGQRGAGCRGRQIVR